MANSNAKTEGVNKQEKKRTVRLDFEEHAPFEPTAESKFITSRDFCSLVSSVFRSTFIDYKGAIFEIINGNIPSIAIFFNQLDESVELDERIKNGELLRGISRAIPEGRGTSKNDLLARIRIQDANRRDGDRYYLTDDGMSVLEELILPAFIDRTKNKVNWRRIVVPTATTQQVYGGPQPTQLTKVSGLSIERLASKIYGDTDDKGSRYQFSVQGMSSMFANPQAMGMNFSKNYMLHIMKISEEKTAEIARQCNMIPTNGLDII